MGDTLDTRDISSALGEMRLMLFKLCRFSIVPLSLLVSFTSFAGRLGHPSDAYNRPIHGGYSGIEEFIFDKHKMHPDELIFETYQKSQFLFLGKSNHSNYQVYLYLLNLLKRVKEDPSLKYLVIERSALNEKFFREGCLSGPTMAVYEQFGPFCDFEGINRNTDLIVSNVVFPEVFEINKKRSDNPIIIVPIDGALQLKENAPNTTDATKLPDHYRPDQFSIISSWNRENQTKENFKEMVLRNLKPNEKVIVVYHLGHLVQGMEGKLPKIESEKSWIIPDWHPSNWLSMLFRETSELRKLSQIILLDEYDPLSPTGFFTFTKRQISRYPNRAFGVKLSHFRGISSERGMDLFQENSHLRNSVQPLYRMFRSQAEISDLGDALIFTPGAAEETKKIQDTIDSEQR